MTAGLAEWFCADPKAKHLRELLDVLDPAPPRIAVRLAIAEGDEARVRTLVSALDGSEAPAWFASTIGFYRMVPKEEGARLMTAALRSHPSDYILAFRCARLNGELLRHPEMLGWAKVTVALRPENPFAHSTLAHAWRFAKNWEEAEASARKVIALSKKYPSYPAPSVLGSVLMDKGDLPGARDQFLAAITIAPEAHGVYYNAGLAYKRLGDLQKAEAYYRKAIDLVEPGNPRFAYYQKLVDELIVEQRSTEKKAPEGDNNSQE